MNNFYYMVLALAILLNAFANIFIKVAMRRTGSTFDSVAAYVFSVASQPMIWIGIFCFGLALAAYSLVLSRLNLSVAYPVMVSLGLIVVVLVSWLAFRETITWPQVAGFVLIIAGVWLVAK